MAHVVSKEVFLNLIPEGSTIPVTVPDYTVAAFVFVPYPVHWNSTIAKQRCVVSSEGR